MDELATEGPFDTGQLALRLIRGESYLSPTRRGRRVSLQGGKAEVTVATHSSIEDVPLNRVTSVEFVCLEHVPEAFLRQCNIGLIGRPIG